MQQLREEVDKVVKKMPQLHVCVTDDGRKFSYRHDQADWEFKLSEPPSYDDLAKLYQFANKVSVYRQYLTLRLRFAKLGYIMRLQQEKMLLAGIESSSTIFLQNGYAYERGDFEKVNDLLCQLELLRDFSGLREAISATSLDWYMVLPAVDDLAARANGRKTHVSMSVTVHMRGQTPQCYKPLDIFSKEYPFDLIGFNNLKTNINSIKTNKPTFTGEAH